MPIEPTANERFEIGQRLGVGGMGSVYRARDLETGEDVAIKILHEHYSANPTFITRFREEGRLTAKIDHANVARVIDYGSWEDRYFIAMELVEGQNLRDRLRDCGSLSPEEATNILQQASAGLAAAHAAGVIHRDLKPENILIGHDGSVKVCDFGLAKMAAATGMTASGVALGTAQYLSPEEVQGRKPGPEADVYALGIVFYEMLIGEPPFRASNTIALALRHLKDKPPRLRELNPAIPADIEDIVLKALSKRPEQRFADASQLKDALSALPITRPAMIVRQPRAPELGTPSIVALSPKTTGFIPSGAWAPLGAIAAAVLALGIVFQPGGGGTKAQGAQPSPEVGVDEPIAAQEAAPPAVAALEDEMVAAEQPIEEASPPNVDSVPSQPFAPRQVAAVQQPAPAASQPQQQPVTTYNTPSGQVSLYQTADGPVLVAAGSAAPSNTTTATGGSTTTAVTTLQTAPAKTGPAAPAQLAGGSKGAGKGKGQGRD